MNFKIGDEVWYIGGGELASEVVGRKGIVWKEFARKDEDYSDPPCNYYMVRFDGIEYGRLSDPPPPWLPGKVLQLWSERQVIVIEVEL